MSEPLLKIFILLMVGLFLASPALAIDPLVPCGLESLDDPSTPEIEGLCTTCDALVLGKNISDFILVYLVPAISALFFIYAGFEILLGGGIASRVAKGRAVFQSTAYGLLIIFLAWMIVNTVLRTVAGDDNIAENWWRLECREGVGGVIPPGGSTGDGGLPGDVGPSPSTGAGDTSGNDELPPNVGTENSDPTISIPPDNLPLRSPILSPSVSVPTVTSRITTNCGDFSLVCSSTARSCPGFRTDRTAPAGNSNWSYLIFSLASQYPIPGVNTAKFLETIMRIESNGVLDRVSSSTPPSCGLMQFQAATANMFADQCGIQHAVSCDWLRGRDLKPGETLETVARASICMSSKYFTAMKNGACYARYQGRIGDLAAGYNGGDGCNQTQNRGNALALSVSCSGRTTADPKYDLSCNSSRPTLRYECLWNNLSHTTCNTGFNETRDYVAKFNACYN